MGSANPITTVSCDDKNTILAFRPSTTNKLSMDEIIIGESPQKVLYKQPGSDKGIVAMPGSLSAVKSRGLVMTYGVVNITAADSTVTKVLAQLSPVPMILENNEESIAMNTDNLSVAATCDGGSKVYIFTIEKDGSNYDIQQILINYQSGGRPELTFGGTNPSPIQKSNLAVVTDAPMNRRWVFFQSANSTITAFKFPDMKTEAVTSSHIAAATPLGATIAKVGEKRILCLYYISNEDQKLRRTTKELSKDGAEWTSPVDVASDSEGRKVSDSSDLSVTTLGNVNWIFFIENKNKAYGMPTKDVIT